MRCEAFWVVMAGVMLISLAGSVKGAPAAQTWRVVPVGRLGLQVWRGEDHLFSLDVEVQPPDGLRSRPEAMPAAGPQGERIYEEDLTFYRWQTPEAGPLVLHYEVRQAGQRALQLRLRCEAEDQLQLQGVRIALPSLDRNYYLEGGRATAATAGGETVEFPIPHTRFRQPLGNSVEGVRLEPRAGEGVELEFSEPATAIYQAHNLHIHAIRGALPTGEPREFTLTVRFPKPVEFQPENQVVDTSDWFLYRGQQDFRPGSSIGMEEWLDAPAGKRGYVQIDEENARFAFEDGTPVKFWGTNISWTDMARPADEVVRYADKLAKHGVNIVRMVKFIHEHTAHDGFLFDASAVFDGILDPEDPLKFHEGVMRRSGYALRSRRCHML